MGRGLWDDIIPKIKSARPRITVFSPWASKETLNILVEKASKGVDVMLYASDDLSSRLHTDALLSLFETKKPVTRPGNKLLKYIGLLLFILGLIATLYLSIMIIVSIIGGLMYLYFQGKYKYRRVCKLGKGKLRIFHAEPLNIIHAKIYIIDNRVGIGSVNFTLTGPRNDLEVVLWIRDRKTTSKVLERISEISKIEKSRHK